MKAILTVFLTEYLRDDTGALAPLSEAMAREYAHGFNFAVYFTPAIGALVAEGVLGKYRTIVYFSLVYCAGHATVALSGERHTLFVLGLALIALGAGGIKPCVSANLGDQFGALNQHLLSRSFSYFYLSINLGGAPHATGPGLHCVPSRSAHACAACAACAACSGR